MKFVESDDIISLGINNYLPIIIIKPNLIYYLFTNFYGYYKHIDK